MTTNDILQLRLTNQQLIKTKFHNPADVVRWFGAVQSQDYSNAKWGVGQRLPGATDETLEKAFTDGDILRTHVMRPTWHFVHPSDIRWMLLLTAPRVKAAMASYNRKLELDKHVFSKSNAAIAKALQGKTYLTRQELKKILTGIGIKTDVQRLAHLMMEAELDAIICSGPRRGLQFTYALLAERAPEAKNLTFDEALAEHTKRYFQSHGPATVKDFVWWSGLTTSDARKGIEMQKASLSKEVIEGKEYWLFPSQSLPLPDAAYLLPNYDEYGIAYTEREAFFDPEYNALLNVRGNATFQHLIVSKGHMIGTWKRTLKKEFVVIEAKFFSKVTSVEIKKVKEAAEKYAAFLNLKLRLA